MTPLLILLSTIFIGFLLRKIPMPSIPGNIISVIVWLLLLFMGISLGSNSNIIDNLASYGTKAVVIGSLAVLGSCVAALVLSRISKKRTDER